MKRIHKVRLLVAILAGTIVAGLTVLALDYTQISGGAAYFMAPGLYMAASFGNDYFFPSTWRVAVLNFIFYFGLGYVCTMVWQKQISKAK
jgi:hypothetical protein